MIGIYTPYMIIQYLVFASSCWSSGIPPPSKRHPKKAILMHRLVDIPKPFFIRWGGIISSIIFGVVQIRTPVAAPYTNLPKHIYQKLRNIAIIEPSKAMILNYMIVLLLPFFTKSPAKTQPREIPTIVLVVNMVELRSTAYGSQFNWYLRAGIMGPVAAIQKPNYILLIPMTRVSLNR